MMHQNRNRRQRKGFARIIDRREDNLNPKRSERETPQENDRD